ncbi:MAG: hypothetical protein IPQ09_24580 [Myxococcales bacterium]|nr:hypothetical protein [Myxococcales bacterium]HQY63108.1 hypothetical protein [Polyangiaceae bacterium]
MVSATAKVRGAKLVKTASAEGGAASITDILVESDGEQVGVSYGNPDPSVGQECP